MLDQESCEDALSAFNKSWMEKLNEKRAVEVELQQLVNEKATEDMSKWVTQRNVRLKAKKDSNRYQEQVLLETLESDVDAGNVWDGITKLIDTSNDVMDVKNADVTRMRKLLIQLKNEPVETSHVLSS